MAISFEAKLGNYPNEDTTGNPACGFSVEGCSGSNPKGCEGNKVNYKPLFKASCLMTIWLVCYIASLELFRFKFGMHKISMFYLFMGVPVMLLFAWPGKPKSN